MQAFHLRVIGRSKGFTLIELMVVVTIVGILAAVAIPAFVRYIKDARVSEAISNVQSLMEAENAYYARFQQFTTDLPWCPKELPGSITSGKNYATQLWPAKPDTACGDGWTMLGWVPQQAIAFRYRVFSAYNTSGVRTQHPTVAPPVDFPSASTFGVDWGTHVPETAVRVIDENNVQVTMPAWCAVEAESDTDVDGKSVFIRTNSINNAIFRCDSDDNPPGPTTPPTY